MCRAAAYPGQHDQSEKLINLGAVVLPFVATLAAIALLWNQAGELRTTWRCSSVMYLLTAPASPSASTACSPTAPSHPQAGRVRLRRARLDGRAGPGDRLGRRPPQAPRAHRREGDPHSPHVGHGEGVGGVLRGLWHAHIGWLLTEHGRADRKRYAPDLCEDPGMRLINRRFVSLWCCSASPSRPLAGFLITGTWAGAATGLLWGGLVRVFFVHHVTWSVNSVCHFLGTRRFDVEDHSTNVFWLALPSLGESWHHNHHAFPRSAVHGLRRWELDPSALVIRALERLGLAWNVVRIAPERQQAKLQEAS